MNREQRRRFNRQHHTNLTKEEFDAIELFKMMQSGVVSMSDITNHLNDNIRVDLVEKVPDGTPVKLNYERIVSMKKDLSDCYIQWLSAHKEEVFHIEREYGRDSLVCLVEDGQEGGRDKWLFDIFNDLLYYDAENKSWKMLK